MTGLQKNKGITIISFISIAAGLLVMLGWMLHVPVLKQLVPGFVNMVFNTALSFVLYGGALLLTQYPPGKYKTAAFFILAASGMLIGLITLIQFVFHFNTGLDELFIRDAEKISPQPFVLGAYGF